MKTQVMQSTAYYSRKAAGGHKLPNAAAGRYYLERIVDGILAAAITISAVVIAIVLITM